MNTGTSLTLSDQKAILLYLGFFPAFISLSALSVPDAMIIIGVMAWHLEAPSLSMCTWLCGNDVEAGQR